ncbi:hypothetical protein GCK72_003032 [Caenorhabditis remanei]|uniref:Uncharacterized protein n=1 Tax=Caenorhabditis remanei TaxID=31234 RepID=A0A6A5HWF3_CAERE|nr:hypothetical protein GCK72_003032 [Caenorhabditis remanei]KAF1771206.1 hypothetical protein GCK72_003032 [Caenorhabditis remanei]
MIARSSQVVSDRAWCRKWWGCRWTSLPSRGVGCRCGLRTLRFFLHNLFEGNRIARNFDAAEDVFDLGVLFLDFVPVLDLEQLVRGSSISKLVWGGVHHDGDVVGALDFNDRHGDLDHRCHRPEWDCLLLLFFWNVSLWDAAVSLILFLFLFSDDLLNSDLHRCEIFFHLLGGCLEGAVEITALLDELLESDGLGR